MTLYKNRQTLTGKNHIYHMQHRKTWFIKLFSAGTLALLFITGCENDPSDFGSEVLPNTDFINARAHSEEIPAINILSERITTDQFIANAYGILGYLNDPLFGRTKSEIITEFNLASKTEGFHLDAFNYKSLSLELNLTYSHYGWIGDSLANHTLRVYELSERLDSLTRFYNNDVIEGRYFIDKVGETQFNTYANLNDSTWKARKETVLKIELNSVLREKLFNLSKQNLTHRDSLKNVFHGLYISVVDPDNPNETGSLIRLNMLASTSNLNLRYLKESYDLENDVLLDIDTLSYIFPINTETRYFSRYEHSYESQVPFNSVNTSHLFIQGMAGSIAEIDLNEIIGKWNDSLKIANTERFKYGISGVDLIFYVDDEIFEANPGFYVNTPQQLAIYQKNADGRLVPPTYNNAKSGIFSGYVSLYSKENKRFVFTMSEDFFAKVAKGEITNLQPFYLQLVTPQFNFNRLVLHNNHPEKHPQIKVRYILRD
jgi:hypothetical protein